MGTATAAADALIRITDPEIRRFLGEKWAMIEEQFAPVHFILFGSRINGTPHEWSDIDAVVVSDRFADTRFLRRAYQFKTAVRPHLAMTALCYTPEEFERVRRGIGVVADACAEGVWVK
ncbi:MAG TPA: nucleotidyltransferase domain-containing protein [Gemmataceae bacterium]|nr:nucleotidyltransferase domain-containing protein [Gemmataceae bacterium]